MRVLLKILNMKLSVHRKHIQCYNKIFDPVSVPSSLNFGSISTWSLFLTLQFPVLLVFVLLFPVLLYPVILLPALLIPVLLLSVLLLPVILLHVFLLPVLLFPVLCHHAPCPPNP